MSHPLFLALFDDREGAARGVKAAHALGIERDRISIVARTHDEETALARSAGGTPGVDLEDSRPAARLGELGGQILAAIALVMPGIGPIVAAGPLSAELGEAAGHAAGGVPSVLRKAGVGEKQARDWERRIEQGAVLLGIHARTSEIEGLETAVRSSGARETERARWE